MALIVGTAKLYCQMCRRVTTFKVWTISEEVTLASCTETRLDVLRICRWKPTTPVVIAVALARAKTSTVDCAALNRDESEYWTNITLGKT